VKKLICMFTAENQNTPEHLVVSTGVQTVVLPDVPTVPAQSVGSGSDVESAVDDIHPHDSVSMAGAPRFEPPPRFEPHRMRLDLPPFEFSRHDDVSFDELVEQYEYGKR
jgi:hypothetical protein